MRLITEKRRILSSLDNVRSLIHYSWNFGWRKKAYVSDKKKLVWICNKYDSIYDAWLRNMDIFRPRFLASRCQQYTVKNGLYVHQNIFKLYNLDNEMKVDALLRLIMGDNSSGDIKYAFLFSV